MSYPIERGIQVLKAEPQLPVTVLKLVAIPRFMNASVLTDRLESNPHRLAKNVGLTATE